MEEKVRGGSFSLHWKALFNFSGLACVYWGTTEVWRQTDCNHSEPSNLAHWGRSRALNWSACLRSKQWLKWLAGVSNVFESMCPTPSLPLYLNPIFPEWKIFSYFPFYLSGKQHSKYCGRRSFVTLRESLEWTMHWQEAVNTSKETHKTICSGLPGRLVR